MISTVRTSLAPTGILQVKSPAGWVIAFFWLALFALGYPLPCQDDLYFIGPAFHLFAGGNSSNPYCPITTALGATDNFFVYMPLHARVLAGWLVLFGQNHLSLAAFQTLCAALVSLAITIVADRGAPGQTGAGRALAALAVSFSVACFLGSLGFRPEALGFVFFSWGLVGLCGASSLEWFMGSTFLALAVITCPTLVFAVPIVAGSAFYLRQVAEDSWSKTLHRLFLTAGGVLAVFLLFLFLIHFQLIRFLAVFHGTSILASHYALLGNLQNSTGFNRFTLRALALAGEPLLPLISSLAVALFLPKLFVTPLSRPLIISGALLGFSAYIPAMTSWGAMRLPGFTAILLSLFIILRLRSPFTWRFGLPVWSVAAFLYLCVSGIGLIQTLGHLLCPPGAPSAVLQAEVTDLHPTQVYVDNFALAAVYNYHLAPHFLDYSFSLNNGGFTWPRPSAFPPGSVLVASRQTLARAGAIPSGSYRPIPFPGISSLYPSDAGNPYDCVVIKGGPAADGQNR